MPILIKGEKVKDPRRLADGFNNFFLTVNEILNLHQAGKEDAALFLRCISQEAPCD
jgi:hypothetical protein